MFFSRSRETESHVYLKLFVWLCRAVDQGCLALCDREYFLEQERDGRLGLIFRLSFLRCLLVFAMVLSSSLRYWREQGSPSCLLSCSTAASLSALPWPCGQPCILRALEARDFVHLLDCTSHEECLKTILFLCLFSVCICMRVYLCECMRVQFVSGTRSWTQAIRLDCKWLYAEPSYGPPWSA